MISGRDRRNARNERKTGMDIQYRTAGAGDLEQLMQSRMDTLRAVNRLEDDYVFSGELISAAEEFFLRGDQTTVLAEAEGRTVGCATMCYYTLMPTFSHPSGRRAHLMNVYTEAAWRRKGIAFRMVSMLISEAWKRDVTEISLDATESGRPLYRRLGFEDSDECMVLKKP